MHCATFDEHPHEDDEADAHQEAQPPMFANPLRDTDQCVAI